MNKWLLIAASFLAACGNAEGSNPESKEPSRREKSNKVAPKARAARVEVAVIGDSSAKLDLVLPGEVVGSRTSQLASPMGGYVERVLFEVGDTVKAGQSLAWINRAPLEVQLAQAKIRVDRTVSDLEAVERAGKSVAKTRRDAARFEADSAKAAFDLAKLYAERAVVRAPFAGVIAARTVEQGEVLNPGGEVARLIRMDPVHVSLSVSDHDVVNLRKGLHVKVRTDARSGVFDGEVYRVSPAASLNTRTFEVLVEVKNPDGQLRPGMIATVRGSFVLEGDGISIPQYVLVTRLDGNGVFVEDNGIARWRPVELGNIVRGQVIVDKGIARGDRVVVTGHRELAEGDRLLIGREGRCCVNGQIAFGAE